MSAPGRPKRELLPLGGKARSAKGAPMSLKLLALQGPNLDRLGRRDPTTYGSLTLARVQEAMTEHAAKRGAEIDHVQSNWEGALLDWLHERQDAADAIIVNPAGLTAVGHPLRDALCDAALPLAVVHISNLHARPAPWRRDDIFAPIASVYIAGAGWMGYLWAIDGLLDRIGANKPAGDPPPAQR